MRRRTFILIAILVVLVSAIAGCGGSSGGGGDTGDSAGPVDTTSTLYQAAFGVCSSASPAEIKSNYRTTSTEPDAIAQEVAANLAGGSAQDEPEARAGCLAGLEAFSG